MTATSVKTASQTDQGGRNLNATPSGTVYPNDGARDGSGNVYAIETYQMTRNLIQVIDEGSFQSQSRTGVGFTKSFIRQVLSRELLVLSWDKP